MTNNMRVSLKGRIDMVCNEGIVPKPYLDSVGVWTIGIGHTKAAGSPDPASLRGKELTIAEVFELFTKDLKKYEDRVNAAIKVPLKQHQFDALVDFDYNTGGIHRAELTKSINRGDFDKAAEQFMSWKKPPEIIARRRRSMEMFKHGVYDQKFAPVYDVSSSGKLSFRNTKQVNVADLISKYAQTGTDRIDVDPQPPLTQVPSATPRPYLGMNKKGQSTGPEVKEWQETLIRLGYPLPSGADGSFGLETDKATKKFQEENGLLADGRVGALTYAAADRLLNPVQKTTAKPLQPEPEKEPLGADVGKEIVIGTPSTPEPAKDNKPVPVESAHPAPSHKDSFLTLIVKLLASIFTGKKS